MDYDHLKVLIEKAETNSASDDELQQLEEFYTSFENRAGYLDRLPDSNAYQAFIFERINVQLGFGKRRRLHTIFRIAASIAAALAFIMVGVYLFDSDRAGHPKVAQDTALEIVPGKTGATLTLASGKKIRLADVDNGTLAKEANVIISKTIDGQLVYQTALAAEGSMATQLKNTLSTARGEMYDIKLPDGSIVSMNSASSLTYATNLIQGGIRRVKLEGEAYFKVAKDAAHPFIVESHGQEILVLGTHFNVNAYADEPVIKTTLVEGSINVNGHILEPNKQSILRNGRITIVPVDTETEIAWKLGKFIFEGESLGSIMRKVSRWYDVDIEMNEELAQKTFTGSLSRVEKVSKLLRSIELTNLIHIKVEGRRVIVSK